jgi:hypothetical protein
MLSQTGNGIIDGYVAEGEEADLTEEARNLYGKY